MNKSFPKFGLFYSGLPLEFSPNKDTPNSMDADPTLIE